MSEDTTSRAAARFLRLMMARSAQERARMGASMFDAAREVVLSSIRAKHPGIDRADERVQLFLRFYESDLSAEQIDRAVARIRSAASGKAQD